MAIKYSPSELQLYLIDFKKGVEFKIYATHRMPHARAIAIESDREFGLSVLRKIDEELKVRGDKFRRLNVQNVSQFRNTSDEDMPRILLVIDEFQEFFTEEDSLARDATLLLDRIVRQGRAFGVHVILGSQTLGGTQTLPRSTIGQMGIRIALQCNESDSYLIFNENNNAARLLSRPGEAIINSHSGLPEHNSPFQVAWLSDEKHRQELVSLHNKKNGHPFIFEGNLPSSLDDCEDFWKNLDSQKFYLGEPCAIEPSTHIKFNKGPGQNALLISSNDEASVAMLCSALSTSCSKKSNSINYLLNGFADQLHHQNYFQLFANSANCCLPGKSEEIINDIYAQMEQRRETPSDQSIFVFASNFQRFRRLQKKDDFSWDETEKTAADKLEELIQFGPENGIHFIIHFDSWSSFQRLLSTKILNEFDHRILMQMSQSDSLACIDRGSAAKLELHTALYYRDHNGSSLKFRPFALPDLNSLKKNL